MYVKANIGVLNNLAYILFDEMYFFFVQSQNAYPPFQSNFINWRDDNGLFNPQTYNLSSTDAFVEFVAFKKLNSHRVPSVYLLRLKAL